MPELRLFLLGNLRLESDGVSIPLQTKGDPKWIALLAYLAVERKPMDRRKLADLIFEYEKQPLARFRRHTLETLKKKIPDECLLITSTSVQLDTERVWVDVNYFLDALAEYSANPSTNNVSELPPSLEACLTTYGGDFLEGYTFPEIGQFSDWQEGKQALLRRKFVEAAQDMIATLYRRGDYTQAEHYARLWVRYRQNDVQAHAWLLSIFEQAGRKNAVDRHMRSSKPYFDAYGITRTHLNRAREGVKRDVLAMAPAPTPAETFPSELAMPDAEKGNPAFYQNYLDTLYKLGRQNPQEAIRFAKNLSTILFDLMDKPHEVDRLLNQLEEQLPQGDESSHAEMAFNLKLQRLGIYRALAMTDKVVQLIDDVKRDDAQLVGADHETRAAWFHNSGLIRCWVQGNYDEAIEDFEKARHEVSFLGDIGWETGLVADIGLVYWNQGSYPLAEENMSFARDRFWQMSGHDLQLVMCIGNLGLIYLFQGKLEPALACITQQLNLATSLRYSKEIRRAIGNRGVIKYHLGQYDEALADLDISTKATKAQNEGYVNDKVNASRCYRAKGDLEKAYQLASEAVRLAQDKHYASIKIIAQRALAECSPVEQAVPLLQDALEGARNRHRAFDEAACLLLLAEYSKDVRAQNALWKKASHILHKIGAERWLEKNPSEMPTL